MLSSLFVFRLAFGNESGLAIIDYLQKTCLLNLGTPDLYGMYDWHDLIICILSSELKIFVTYLSISIKLGNSNYLLL